MARARLGSYVGVATAGVNMVPILGAGKTSYPFGSGFSLRKIAICASEGTHIIINDAEIVLTDSGVFETAEDSVDITRIVFSVDADVNIRFLY